MNENLGPLQSGSTAVIIGGGPGGSGCAITLKRLAREAGRTIEVVLYEPKTFADESGYNQCAGVLSPPADRILEQQLGVPFPHDLVQKTITGYILHSENRRIILDGVGEPSYAVRRIEFDRYLLEQASLRGVRVIHNRVTGLEIRPDRVMVFTEGDCRKADVVVGAFGLDSGTMKLLSRTLDYREPQFLDSIVAKIHPPDDHMAGFGNRIHAFLPARSLIEFGAITPKREHLTVNIAGKGIDIGMMQSFLVSSPVRRVLPFLEQLNGDRSTGYGFFSGRFPISVADRYFGDRFVLVGDAAGLVRAFKGKGINSACLTGCWAAEVLMRDGISRAAFAEHYAQACGEILRDLPYGRIVRHLVRAGSRLGLLDRSIAVAQGEPDLRTALFNAVSGDRLYRKILLDLCQPRLIARAARDFLLAGSNHAVPGE